MANQKGYRHTATRGQAAVYAVAAKLLHRGVSVAMPCVDLDGIDLYAGAAALQIKVAREGKCSRVRGVTYQGAVVTSSSNNRERATVYGPKSKADFYVFVSLDTDKFWIVPTRELGERVATRMRPEWEGRWDAIVGAAA